MKVLTLAVFTAQVAIASAISIQVDNFNGVDTNLVTNEVGALVNNAGGIVAIGHFGAMSDIDIAGLANTTPSNLVSSFTQVGADVAFGGDGFFTGTTVAQLQSGETDADAAGKGVYIVIGNNTMLSDADEFLVFRYGDDFVASPSEGPGTANLIDGRGSLLIGGFNNYGFDNDQNPDTPDAPAFNLVLIPVPEPSSFALLGIGLVGFTLRRRR